MSTRVRRTASTSMYIFLEARYLKKFIDYPNEFELFHI